MLKTIVKKGSNVLYKLLLLHRNIPSGNKNIVLNNCNFLIMVIAFNTSELIKLQHKELKKHLKEGFDYLVVDNSSDKNTSQDLYRFCKSENISYVKVPKNPLTGIRASGSHGVALNWCYKNIIQKYKPRFFGFLDHDVFPIKETILTEKITSGFYGIIRERKEPFWYLWPGFSFFEYEKIQNFKVNFFPYHAGENGEIFLDTGGSNYNSIYKKIGKESIRRASSRLINRETNKDFIKGEDSSQVFEIIDNAWLHLRQIAWRKESSNKINEIEEIKSSAEKFLV